MSSGFATTVLAANDGHPLAARVYGDGRSAVVIAGAMGVPQRFYRRFAEYLAGNGLRVVSFDYRGIGESALEHGAPVSMAVWAEQDLEGVLRHVESSLGAERTAVVGHSMGGQLLGLTEAATRVSAAYFVGSQSGYWRHWDGLGRLKMLLVWHALIPVSTSVLGNLPGALLGGGEDLPAEVAAQWARWGRHPGYVLSHAADARARFARLTLPICFVRISDDALAPSRAVNALASCYASAAIEARTIEPRELGSRELGSREFGHFGFFRPTPGERAWPHALGFLRAHLSAPNRINATAGLV